MPIEPRPEALPFREAAEYFREKIRLPSRTWTDIREGMHARGFVVAGAMRDQLLADFQSALQRAFDKGETLEQFRKRFDVIVADHGWAYNGNRNWRSRVIYETNIHTAYQAGRYKQMTSPHALRERPFWQYRHGDSAVPRLAHLAWDGLVLAADDAWWKTNYPPNGWGCKCRVFALKARELERFGKSGPDRAPPLEMQERKFGAGTIPTPKGVDPGWGYNVGEAAWGRTQALRAMEDTGPWRDVDQRGPAHYGRSERIPADTPRAEPGPRVAKGDARALREAFTRAIGGESATLRDPTGTPVRVTDAIVEHMLAREKDDGREAYFPFLRELIEEPYEVWINFARNETSGRVAIRRRYAKAVAVSGGRSLMLIADVQEGQWIGTTMFEGATIGRANNVRKGRLLWGRP